MDNEWNLNSGEPKLFDYFGRWDKRKETPSQNNPEVKLYKKEDLTFNSESENVGDVFLRELNKHHNLEIGFSIQKIQDIIIMLDDSKMDCQLFSVNTPWNDIKRFVVYSPKDNEGFKKILSKMRGKVQLGEQGTPQNPQPYWSWNTLEGEGLDKIETLGPPVMVEYMGAQYFDYLSNFFKKGSTKIR